MVPKDWDAVASGLTALQSPESGSLPGDERLLLSWNPATFRVMVDPAFHRNPPVEVAAQYQLLARFVLQQEIRDPKAVIRDFGEVAALPPPASGQAEPPALTAWRVVDFPSGFEDPAGPDLDHRILGEFTLDDQGNGHFTDHQRKAGTTELVIAVDPATGVRWFWFEPLPASSS